MEQENESITHLKQKRRIPVITEPLLKNYSYTDCWSLTVSIHGERNHVVVSRHFTLAHVVQSFFFSFFFFLSLSFISASAMVHASFRQRWTLPLPETERESRVIKDGYLEEAGLTSLGRASTNSVGQGKLSLSLSDQLILTRGTCEGRGERPLERSSWTEQVFGARLIENGLRLESTVDAW